MWQIQVMLHYPLHVHLPIWILIALRALRVEGINPQKVDFFLVVLKVIQDNHGCRNITNSIRIMIVVIIWYSIDNNDSNNNVVIRVKIIISRKMNTRKIIRMISSIKTINKKKYVIKNKQKTVRLKKKWCIKVINIIRSIKILIKKNYIRVKRLINILAIYRLNY